MRPSRTPRWWRAARRRSFAPRRPLVFAEQVELVVVTVAVLLAGVVVAWLVLAG